MLSRLYRIHPCSCAPQENMPKVGLCITGCELLFHGTLVPKIEGQSALFLGSQWVTTARQPLRR